MQTSVHIVTPSKATFNVSSSFNKHSGGKDIAEEKRQSKLDNQEKHRERTGKQQKKEIAGDFLCTGEEMLFVVS